MFRRQTLGLALALAAILMSGSSGAAGSPLLPARSYPAYLAEHAPGATPDRVSWLGGQWFALGYNYPWHSYNYDFGPDRGSSIRGMSGKIDGQLADLRGAGTHVTRWYVFNDAARYPEFDQQGRVTGLPDSFYDNFDAMLELVSRHDMYVIPVLVDALITNRERDRRTGHSAIVTDPAIRQSYLDNALRPVLQRYGRHPHILAWSVFNEPDWAAGFTNDREYIRVPVPVLRDFIAQSAQYVHTYAAQGAALDLGGLPWLDQWRDLGLDLYLAHWYPWIDRYYGAQHSPYNRSADSFNLDKPIVIAEFPIRNTPHSVQHSLDTFYANGYAGALAWCYPPNNPDDEYCDAQTYASSRDTVRAWAQSRAADVHIRPADRR
jgi:hypothetical protein